MLPSLESSWNERLSDEFSKPYFKSLSDFVDTEYENYTCYPPKEQIFAAFDRCSFDSVKVVIIGQDPYHGPGQAHGLCFSVNDGIKFPPSLRNIFIEISNDTGSSLPTSGNLERWADQGVLLLNSVLSVRENSAGSHSKKGWEEFTDAVIKIISERREFIVFMLWGSYAKKKGKFIDRTRHCVLESGHPSPLSANQKLWFSCAHFSQANKYLQKHGILPIQW